MPPFVPNLALSQSQIASKKEEKKKREIFSATKNHSGGEYSFISLLKRLTSYQYSF